MKSTCVAIVFALLSTPLFAQSTIPAATFHANGAFAQVVVTANTSIGFSYFSGYVNRGTTSAGDSATFLTFDSFSYDYATQTFVDTFGYGEIPNATLIGGSTAHMTLSVDTSQVAGFQTSTCTFNFSSYTCQPGPFGLIHVDWQKSDQLTEHSTSTNQLDFPQVSYHTQGTSDFAFSISSGSYFGTPFTNASGNVGVQHSTTITLYKTH